MKKVILILLAAVLTVSVSGCTSILDEEKTEIITDYKIKYDEELLADDAQEIHSAEDFSEMLKNLVENYVDAAAFIVRGMDRTNLEETLGSICRDFSINDPLGAYATYYISCDVTPIISYDKVVVSIVYKHTQDEISRLDYVASERYFEQTLRDNLKQYSSGFAFYTTMDFINSDYIQKTADELYRVNPLSIATMPKIEVTFHPSNTGKHIVEISMMHSYTESVLESMTASMGASAEQMIKEIEAEHETEEHITDYAYVKSIYDKFSKEIICVHDGYSEIYNTAYELLTNKIGTNESYAMAFKALCDKLMIDCTVVKGTKDGVVYFWNIVTLDNENYHIDTSSVLSDSGEFLFGDSTMKENYMWDASVYPACTGNYQEEQTVPEDTDTFGETENVE